MISRLTGKLVGLTDETATLQVGGVYYDLYIPSGLHDSLKKYLNFDTAITLHTIYYIEAGDMKSAHYPRMVGFTDPVDKDFFQLFISAPGLGVKKALRSLVLPISEIARYIEEKNAQGLSKLPGVGVRSAEKIIAELSGKTAKFALAQGQQPLAPVKRHDEDFVDEAIQALQQLQYSKAEAEKMVDAALRGSPKVKSTEELIAKVFAVSKKG